MEWEKMAYKMMNQDFVKLDKFDGSNFIRWQDKMKFLLTALKIFLCSGPQFAANSGSYSSKHWTIEATKDQEGGRWTSVQGSHSEYTIRPVVWSFHNHDFSKGNLEGTKD